MAAALYVEGQAVLCQRGTGDVIRCRIVKALKSYAFGRIDAILAPAPAALRRIVPCALPAAAVACAI